MTAEAFALHKGKGVDGIAALTPPRAGDTAQAEKLVNKLNQEFPLDTMVQNYLVPTIRTAIELDR